MKFDFTMTACVRPEVVRQTLISFRGRLQDVCMAESVLYLNVDPVPEGEPDRVTDVAVEFFGAVIPYYPDVPSFPAAVKWCWSKPNTPYFFHLEDDWRLAEPVYLYELAKMLDPKPELACVNLRAYDQGNDLICLCPGLFRTAHAKAIAQRLSLLANPEKQLRPADAQNPEGGKQGNFTGTRYPDHRIIFDTGREWLQLSGWRKASGGWFTSWSR